MLRGSLGLALISGCGTVVAPADAGTSSTSTSTTTSTSTSTSAAATTAMLDDSGGESSSSTGYELPKLDVAAPDFGPIVTEVCDVGAQLGNVEVVTPTSTFTATHAWWGVHYCCFASPMLVLADAPQLDVSEDLILTPHVALVVRGSSKHQESPYLGVYEVGVRDVGSPDFDDAMGDVEVLEPLQPDMLAEPVPSFVATLDVDGNGWSITGSVNAPYCAAAEPGPCICD